MEHELVDELVERNAVRIVGEVFEARVGSENDELLTSLLPSVSGEAPALEVDAGMLYAGPAREGDALAGGLVYMPAAPDADGRQDLQSAAVLGQVVAESAESFEGASTHPSIDLSESQASGGAWPPLEVFCCCKVKPGLRG